MIRFAKIKKTWMGSPSENTKGICTESSKSEQEYGKELQKLKNYKHSITYSN